MAGADIQTEQKVNEYLFLLNMMAKSPIGRRALLVKIRSKKMELALQFQVPVISRPFP